MKIFRQARLLTTSLWAIRLYDHSHYSGLLQDRSSAFATQNCELSHDEYYEMTLSLEKLQMASLFFFIWMLLLKSLSLKSLCWESIVVVYFSFKALHPWSLILFCFANCYKEVNSAKVDIIINFSNPLCLTAYCHENHVHKLWLCWFCFLAIECQS